MTKKSKAKKHTIKELAKKNGLTLEKVGARFKIKRSRSLVSRWNTKSRSMKLADATELAGILNVTINDLDII